MTVFGLFLAPGGRPTFLLGALFASGAGSDMSSKDELDELAAHAALAAPAAALSAAPLAAHAAAYQSGGSLGPIPVGPELEAAAPEHFESDCRGSLGRAAAQHECCSLVPLRRAGGVKGTPGGVISMTGGGLLGPYDLGSRGRVAGQRSPELDVDGGGWHFAVAESSVGGSSEGGLGGS